MSRTLQHFPKRIFLDATYTICSGRNSGIERVVRNLIRECEVLAKAGYIDPPTIVVSHNERFYALPDKFRAAFEHSARMQANILESTPGLYRRAAERICDSLPSKTARKWLLPQPGHLGIFKLLHSARQWTVFQRLANRCSPIEAQAGDLFILPDAYWVKRLRNSVWAAAGKVRSQQAAVSTVIYDLIPLTHPQFVGHKRRDAFNEYLTNAASNSDMLVTISNTVRYQLQEFLESHFPSEQHPMVRSFQLGAELKTAQGHVRESVHKVFPTSGNTPYLMVATFDPRKNHNYLLDAFDQLWQAGQRVDLCLVGRYGSRCDELVERIKRHWLLGKRLHVFDDLSDAELHHCYSHARGVIFPSIVEGFGLPIVESLWFGNKTFVSDTPIHREVGQGDCCYFGLECPSSLAKQLARWEEQRMEDNPILPVRRPVSWTESCQQFLSHCLSLFEADGKKGQAAAA